MSTDSRLEQAVDDLVSAIHGDIQRVVQKPGPIDWKDAGRLTNYLRVLVPLVREQRERDAPHGGTAKMSLDELIDAAIELRSQSLGNQATPQDLEGKLCVVPVKHNRTEGEKK